MVKWLQKTAIYVGIVASNWARQWPVWDCWYICTCKGLSQLECACSKALWGTHINLYRPVYTNKVARTDRKIKRHAPDGKKHIDFILAPSSRALTNPKREHFREQTSVVTMTGCDPVVLLIKLNLKNAQKEQKHYNYILQTVGSQHFTGVPNQT